MISTSICTTPYFRWFVLPEILHPYSNYALSNIEICLGAILLEHLSLCTERANIYMSHFFMSMISELEAFNRIPSNYDFTTPIYPLIALTKYLIIWFLSY